MQTSLSIDIDAPIEQVWAEAIDFASHADWMRDARAIRFEGKQREGIGTVLIIETRVGPFRTSDRFQILAVEPMRLITGRHHGIFTGEGTFELAPLDPNRTRFRWRERVRFPWYFGGPAGAWIGRMVLSRIWRTNLAALKHKIEQDL